MKFLKVFLIFLGILLPIFLINFLIVIFAQNPWSCGANFKDYRDGNVYSTVQIGTQCWMAENLAYLPSVVGPATGSTTVPYYYVYGYDGTSVSAAKAYTRTDGGAEYNVYNTYGVLYNWPAAMDGDTGESSQGICPEGSHLPSDAEQHTLDSYLATGTCDPARTSVDCTPAGKSLKSVRTATGTTCTGATHTDDHPRWNYHATECGSDISGFNALPGGYRGTDGSFYRLGSRAYFWSSSSSGANAWRRYLDSSVATVNRAAIAQANGDSVRCILDDPPPSFPMELSDVFLHVGSATQFKVGALGVGGILESLAGLLLNTSGAQPTCNASTFGLTRVRQRGTHNYAFDEVVVCVTNQDGGYKWQVVSTPFTCGRDFTDVRDSNVYPTKQIGSQCWMTKDLAYLPSVVGPATGSTTVPYYYVYGYDGTSVSAAKAYTRTDGGATYNVYNTYGVLYNWPAAMAGDTGESSQGICPDGWHLPSDAEQHTLDRFLATGTCDPARSGVSACTPAGKSLKSVRTATGTTCTGATHTDDHPRWDYHATLCGSDISGFNALPGGRRVTDGSLDRLGLRAHCWSSSSSGAGAWSRYLRSSSALVGRYAYDQAYGFSVRCLRD